MHALRFSPRWAHSVRGVGGSIGPKDTLAGGPGTWWRRPKGTRNWVRPDVDCHQEPSNSSNKTSKEDTFQGGIDVNKAIRWRIITLQSVMVLVLAGAAGFAFAMGSFTTTQIHDELTAQQISFPGTDQIKTGGALDPATFSQEIRDRAGKQVTDGNQARIYANDFLGEHLKGVAGGLTYSTIGSKISAANAALAAASKTDPNYATLQANVATLNGQRHPVQG